MSPFISSSKDVLRGMPVFSGTRLPVQTLWDYLEAGGSIDDFIDEYPSISREQVVGLLEDVSKRLAETLA